LRVQLVAPILIGKRRSPSAGCATGLIVTNVWTKRGFVCLAERRAKITAGEQTLFLGFSIHFGHLDRVEMVSTNMAGFHARLRSPLLPSRLILFTKAPGNK